MKKVDLSEMTEIDEAGNIIKPAEHRRETSSSAEPKAQRIYEADKKENLVSRAAKRKQHKNHTYGKGRVKKVVMSLVLALSATFLALTGCTTDTTDPGKTPGTDPGTNPGTNPTEYSQLLEDILDSEYYNRLSDDYFDNHVFGAEIDGLPSGFLKNEGYDISTFSENQVEYHTISYVKNDDTNSLYVSTRIRNDGPDKYYSCYTLKYKISDQEYEDYYILNKGKYIQSSYFIQELSEQRNPEEVHSVKVTRDYYNNFYKNLTNSDVYIFDVFNTKSVDVDFLNMNLANQTFDIVIRTSVDDKNKNGFIYDNASIRYMSLEPAIIDSVSTVPYDNTIFNGPEIANAINFEEYKNNSDEITYFYSPNNAIYAYLNENDLKQNI